MLREGDSFPPASLVFDLEIKKTHEALIRTHRSILSTMLDVTDFIAERGGNPEKIKCALPCPAPEAFALPRRRKTRQ